MLSSPPHHIEKKGWFAGAENCYDYKVYKSHIDVLYI